MSMIDRHYLDFDGRIEFWQSPGKDPVPSLVGTRIFALPVHPYTQPYMHLTKSEGPSHQRADVNSGEENDPEVVAV
jgi:hypothetical protein